MNKQYLTLPSILVMFLILLTLAMVACVPGTVEPQPASASPAVEATIAYLEEQLNAGNSIPIVVLSSPLTGQAFKLGQEIEVISGSIDKQGIVSVEILVDDQVIHTSQFTPQPNTEFAVKHIWMLDKPGKYTLQVQAYNLDNSMGQSQQVLVQVLSPASPTPTKTVTKASQSSVSLPTNTPTPSTTPSTATSTTASPTATPIPDKPYLVVTIPSGLNVRQGPSTRYSRIGRLNPEDRLDILGYNDVGAGKWWQIRYPSASGNIGWVSASADYAAAFNIANAALVAAPPTPTFTPIPAPTAPQADINFGVDRTQIRAGECVTFFWDVKEVKEVYFQGLGVAGNSQARRECPPWTTSYELRVVKVSGNTESRTIRIDVEGTAYQTLKMDIGEHVDFDRNGHVNDDDNDNNDFEWIKSGDERRFQIWDNNDDDQIELAPVGPEPLDIINYEDCDWAVKNLEVSLYIVPFDGLSACFKTDRGKIGKLRFTESDDDAEILWGIWQ